MRAEFKFYSISLPKMPTVEEIKEMEKKTDKETGLILVERRILEKEPIGNPVMIAGESYPRHHYVSMILRSNVMGETRREVTHTVQGP